MNFKSIAEELYDKKEEMINGKDVEDADSINFSKESIEKTLNKIYDKFFDKDNILSRFPLEIYSDEIKCKFIKYIFEKFQYCNDRQLMDNINRKLLKVRKETYIEIEYNKLYSFYDKNLDVEEFLSSNIYALEQTENRKEIRYNKIMSIGNIVNANSNKYKKIMIENNGLKIMGLQKERKIILSELKSYMNMIFDSWIQALLYIVIVNKNILNRKDIISELLILQNNMIERLQEVQNENCDRYKKLKLDMETNEFMLNDAIEKFDIFIMWLEQFDFNQEYTKILNTLEEEIDDIHEKYELIKKQYKTTKNMKILNEDKLRNIICEGEDIFEYDKKLKETKRAIDIFKNYGGRNVNEDSVQDLKVFFREVYMDDNKYSKRSRKAINIMRDYYLSLDSKNIKVDEFSKRLDYIFIREKISRGYFREQDLSSVYKLKNQIQKNAMNLFLEVYKLYDEDMIFDWCNRLSSILFNNLSRLLIENGKFLK